MIHKVEQSLQHQQGHNREKSPLLRERLFYGGCRASKGCMGAYTTLGTALLIFDECLTTTKYHLDGFLQVPYWDCPKGEKVHWRMEKLYLHPVSTLCPKALLISHSQTIGPVQHNCSLLPIFIYYLQLLISSESALQILCKPPHISLRGTGKHSLLHRWQNEVNPDVPGMNLSKEPHLSHRSLQGRAGSLQDHTGSQGPSVPPLPQPALIPKQPHTSSHLTFLAALRRVCLLGVSSSSSSSSSSDESGFFLFPRWILWGFLTPVLATVLK